MATMTDDRPALLTKSVVLTKQVIEWGEKNGYSLLPRIIELRAAYKDAHMAAKTDYYDKLSKEKLESVLARIQAALANKEA